MAHGRPNLVRADTIDLQDQDAPTAADHHKHPESGGIAPHQAAQFQHVQEERRSEEETLADAWNMAGQHGNEQGANGQTDSEAEKKKTEGTDAANGEAEDGSDDEDDDDMMDRMSSSPSIEDGSGTPQHADYERATFNQSPTPTMDSSPFAEVPRHLPLRLGIPRSQSTAVLQFSAVDSLSPSVHTPEPPPLITTAAFAGFLSASSEHHRLQEDIDFEFVYALHTFVATVEGQANATKGDTMVLLDDSNSYWWLVRVVKDSSIGYLPAEHIETPTERLARLNKHRNIDLSQTMLGDNPEKTRNPLKKAMRRRTAKTVQFAAPTYVEASDYDYSTEDEDGMIDPYGSAVEPQQEQMSDRGAPAEVEERNAPEEANVHATRRFSGDSINGGKASLDSTGGKTSMDSKRSSIDDPQLSPKLVDRSEAAPLKSRKGTPRNADSFLKDDSMETRKISLTPGLLRDDSTSKASSTESTRNNSFESLVKTPSPQEERTKRDSKDKKKDKKPEKKQGGMLSGLFKSKKKDKKSAGRDEGELSDMEKVSAEMSRGSPSSSTTALNGNVSPVERMTSGPMSAENRAQTRGKLQKAPPPEASRVMSPIEEPPQQVQPVQQQQHHPPGGGFVAELEGDNAAYEMATGQEDDLPIQKTELVIPPAAPEKSSALSPIANILRSGSTNGEPKPKKAKRSKQRVELDDFDELEEDDKGINPFLEQEERTRQGSEESDRLSASPVEILSPGLGTFMHGTESIHIPQMNVDDDDEDDEEDVDSAKNSDSASTDPSLIEKPTGQLPQDATMKEPTPREAEDSDSTPKVQTPQPTITTSTSKPVEPTEPTTTRGVDDNSTDSFPSTDDDGLSSTATAETPISSSPQQPSAPQSEWDDANLRAWFDADDVKNMLAIIHHSKHDVDADPSAEAVEHPSMQGLFAEERKGVEGMMGELDGLLGNLLKRKGVAFA